MLKVLSCIRGYVSCNHISHTYIYIYRYYSILFKELQRSDFRFFFLAFSFYVLSIVRSCGSEECSLCQSVASLYGSAQNPEDWCTTFELGEDEKLGKVRKSPEKCIKMQWKCQ